MKKKAKSASRLDLRELLTGPRKAFVIVPACLLLLGLGWFTYKEFSVIPPPPVGETPPEEVVEFLAHPQGWIQMPVAQREQFATRMWQHYGQASPVEIERLNRAFATLSQSEQETMARAAIGIVKTHLMKQATEFGRLGTPMQRQQFAKKAVGDMKKVQSALSGGETAEGRGIDVAKGFKNAMPKDSTEVQKIVVQESTPGERAKAEPLVNEMVKQHEQEIRAAQGR